MEEMDVDFDLETDPIRCFLLHQLEEAQSKNSKLMEDISEREAILKFCLEKTTKFDGNLKVFDVWKRIFNNKFVFGIKLLNDKPGLMEIDDIVLNWDSSLFMTYSSKVFRKYPETDRNYLKDEWVATNIFSTAATVILSVEKPTFTRQNMYSINGIITYKINSEEYQLLLPKFVISVHDFNNCSAEVKSFNILKGNEEDFLTCLTANEEFFLVGKFEMLQRNIASMLVIDCMFKELNVVSQRKYFLVDGISASIDGCLIETSNGEDGLIDFKLFCPNDEKFLQLLHYMSKNMDELSILPKTHEDQLFKTAQCSQSFQIRSGQCVGKKMLQKSILDEISFIEKFQRRSFNEGNMEEYIKFRINLIELEYKTDKLYAKNNFSVQL